MKQWTCEVCGMTTMVPPAQHRCPGGLRVEDFGAESYTASQCQEDLANGIKRNAQTFPNPMGPIIEDFAEAVALTVQEGGRHYKDFKIQPVEYIHANGIPFIEGNVIKYVTRWRVKGGVEDLRKARHFIDLLLQLEAGAHASG